MIRLCKLWEEDDQIDTCIRDALNEILNILEYDMGKIMMFNDDKSCVIVKFTHVKNGATFVDYENHLINAKSVLPDNPIGLLLKEKQIILLNSLGSNLYQGKKYTPFITDMKQEIFIPLFSNLKDRLDIIGCLYLGTYRTDINLNDVEFTDNILKRNLQIINGRFSLVYNQFKEKRSLLNTVHLLDNLVKIHEPYMINHNYNVANWAIIIAKSLDLNADEIERLYVAAILHDIGKLYIPQAILNKEGKLSDDEYNTMKHHSIYGERITRELLHMGEYDSKYISQVVKSHHERYDGTGYPDGLKGEAIPLESRIIALGDAVDAMLSQRIYKKPKPIEEVIADISRNRGRQFDPVIADIMIDKLVNVSLLLNEALNQPIIWGTLNITTSTTVYNLQGDLIAGENGYVFEPFHQGRMKEININDIFEMLFYVEKGKKIYEYEVKLDYTTEERFYLSELLIKPSCYYLDMIWDLNGNIHFGTESSASINITRISLDSLTFNLSEEHFNDIIMSGNCLVDVFFEDGTIVSINGLVTKKFEIGDKYCCDYKYIRLPERIRSYVLRKMRIKTVQPLGRHTAF